MSRNTCRRFYFAFGRKGKYMEQEEKRDIVALTGLPVSDELQDILERCDRGEYVSIEEINNTPEMITAATCVSHQTPTILLKDREQIEEHVFEILSNYGSISTDEKGKPLVDDHGNTVYNEDVERGNRLDIVIGLPASGKSSAIVETISKENHSMLIDNDEAKRLFPEFNKGWGAGVVHEESQMIEKSVYLDALNQGKNIVLPKVGSDANKLIQDYVLPAKNKGYKVNVHFVDLDRSKALGRMMRRFIHKGRYLAPKLIDKYVNERDGNRITQAFEKLSKNGMIDGVSRWDNDVDIGQKPELRQTRGLTDSYIIDADIKHLPEAKIVNGIMDLFKQSGIDTYVSEHDIEMQLSIRIEERMNMNYFLEDNDSIDDVDYMKVLKSAMNDNYYDMQISLKEIHKAVEMMESGRDNLPKNIKDAVLNIELQTAIQGANLNQMNEMYKDARDRREALRDAEDIGIGTKNNLVENNITNNNIDGGNNHGKEHEQGRNDEESDTRRTDELRIGGDGGDDRGSNAQSVHRNEREGRGDRQPSENGSSQTQNGNNEKTSERSSEESAVEKIDDDTKALAVKIADRYISVESDGKDWEYMICDEDFGVLYGDKYPDSGARIDEVVNSLVEELKEPDVQRLRPLIYPVVIDQVAGNIKPEDTFEVVDNFKELSNQVDSKENDKVKAAHEAETQEPGVIEKFRARTDELFHKIDDRSASDIEQDVLSTVKGILADYDIDATAIDAVLTGSRSRGLKNDNSDIDVVVEIHGDGEREDSLFNLLNEEKLSIGGVEVDINPILPQESGTLAEYLPGVEAYLEEKSKQMSISSQVDVNAQSEQNVVMENEDYKRAHAIAAKLDEWGQDYDTYEYNDTVDDCAAHIEELTACIMDGQTDSLKKYLQDAIADGEAEDKIIVRAKEILKELDEYKPLAKVEEIEEQNYNMIDNRINNTEPKEDKQPGKIAEKEETRTDDKKQISTGKAFPGARYSNFKIKKNVENAKYLLIADIKMPGEDLIKNQAIGEFKDKETVIAFCKQNNIAYDDITNYLQNMIEHKKKQVKEKSDKEPDKGSPKLGKKGKGAGIDDE